MRWLLQKLVDAWCDWTHGGGAIRRDPTGCINWQCRKCGRWALPTALEYERSMTDRHIREHKR
jgi:hypothetical protein